MKRGGPSPPTNKYRIFLYQYFNRDFPFHNTFHIALEEMGILRMMRIMTVCGSCLRGAQNLHQNWLSNSSSIAWSARERNSTSRSMASWLTVKGRSLMT